MTDLVEIVRTAHACFAEQEAHPYDDGSQSAAVCELVHEFLGRSPNATVAELLDNVRHWMIQDATQMTDEELRLRIAFDARDEKRASIARSNAERMETARVQAIAGIKNLRARLKEEVLGEKERRRLKKLLRELKATRDNTAASASSFEAEARRRGMAA